MEVVVRDHRQHEYSAGETLEFELRKVDNSFANGLRRILLAEVPTLAIDSVTILQNTSVLPDEMLAHRLGLLPMFSMKAREMHYLWDCPTKGCDGCQIRGKLEVSCSDEHHSLRVYSRDMQIPDPEVYPVVFGESKGAWLCTLGRSQKIQCSFIIRKGIGKVHAKFMPVATVSMNFASDIRINSSGFSKLSVEERQSWVDRCPRKVFAVDMVRGGQVDIVNPQACIYCKECLAREPFEKKVDEPLVLVRRRQQDGTGFFDFTFVVESTGVLPVVQLIFDALTVLKKKLTKIERCLINDEAHNPDVVPTRRIGGAPTAPFVVNEDIVERENEEDDLGFVMA